jgi:Zn-finger nucleic acid-binding protein
MGALVSSQLAAAAHDDTRAKVSRARLEHDVRYLRCPVCHEPMQRMNFGQKSGVVVDACKLHGTWFDAGELDAVLAFVAEGGLKDDVVAARALPPSTSEVAQATRVAESLLHEEAMRDEAAIHEATDFVSDLLWILSPGDRYWAWQNRRRH